MTDTQESTDHTRLVRELKKAQTALLDTGTRNRLVHVNRKNQRAKCLNIVNERCDHVFDILRTRGRTMRFRAVGHDTPVDDPILLWTADDDDETARHTDGYLETPIGPDTLEKRLLHLARDERTAEEEQGVNILYLALGFLIWYEDNSSSIERHAPLILLPAELVRDNRRSTYSIRCRAEDIDTNLPLQERLRQDFGITLPDIEEDDEWSPAFYFDAVRDTVASRDRWQVDEDGMQLGFFSFAKLLMRNDLDPRNWPAKALEGSPLGDLLGDGFAPEAGPFDDATRSLDELLDPKDLVQVVDADASQTKVIEEVRGGCNLVVQGPPGTGKSQTITNLIAAAVHDRKTVLFVAEKMAALSVVHNRLQRAGLADICLELHSRHANKREVAQELGRTLAATGNAPQPPPDPEALRNARDELNAIAQAIHEPLDGCDYTPFDAIAESVRQIGRGLPPPRIDRQGLERLTGADRKRIAAHIDAFVEALEVAGNPAGHPFAGVRNLDLQPTERQRLARPLAGAVAALRQLGACFDVARDLGIGIPDTLAAARTLASRLEALAQPPERVAEHAATGTLIARIGDTRLSEALAGGAAWCEAREAAGTIFDDGAWDSALQEVRRSLKRGRSSWLARSFGFAYRRASRALGDLLRGELPKAPADRLALVDQLIDIQTRRRQLAGDEHWLREVLGEHWRGERTDFAGIHTSIGWLRTAADAGVSIPEDVPRLLGRRVDVARQARDLQTCSERAEREAVAALEPLSYDFAAVELGDAMDTAPLAALADRIAVMEGDLDRYEEWQALGRHEQVLREDGLGSLADSVLSGEILSAAASDEFAYACAEARWQHAVEERPELGSLRNTNRHELVKEFRSLDERRTQAVPKLILARHFEQIPRGAAGQMGIIRGEVNRKRRHMPIRRLMTQAGPMVQRIKPVFLMSPVSVAQFLPSDKLDFDLLVIDEASQVRPADALGAIARAGQIVVVGDRKQLPPTTFFDRMTGLDEDTDETEVDGAAAAEMESILTLCEARALRSPMLSWHYRSRDPSLIRVSNKEFYEDRLVLPPSPLELDDDYGLKLRRVDGAYARGRHGGGRAGTNRREAGAVVDAMRAHARERPDFSLGVVTFSKAQSDMMTEVLELARREDPALDRLLREGKAEDTFVKNIENVQGDERDVIFISVGYGPAEPGGRLASMNFGPINNEGGDRRLNVLFTRARMRCEVFVSFDPGDIDLSRTTQTGPRVLKRFLEFARTGRLDQPLPTDHSTDSPFESDVAEVIRGWGYPVDPQVGSAGFRIDIGVRGTRRRGQYILAVECDGATYHGALWARERDRQRQNVLESLGWCFHRIWSTDWFHRRRQEIARLKAGVEEADRASATTVHGSNTGQASAPAQPCQDAPQVPPVLAEAMPTLSASPYRMAALGEFPDPDFMVLDELGVLATRVVEVEGPIHIHEIVRRIWSATGKSRTERRIETARFALLNAESTAGNLKWEGDFCFTEGQLADTPVRDRSSQKGPLASATMLPPIEIRAAAKHLKAESGIMNTDEEVREVARLLGFRRVGKNLVAVIRAALPADRDY